MWLCHLSSAFCYQRNTCHQNFITIKCELRLALPHRGVSIDALFYLSLYETENCGYNFHSLVHHFMVLPIVPFGELSTEIGNYPELRSIFSLVITKLALSY